VVVEESLETKVPCKRQNPGLVNPRKQRSYVGHSTEEKIPWPKLVFTM
jgi:hypothetical protein